MNNSAAQKKRNRNIINSSKKHWNAVNLFTDLKTDTDKEIEFYSNQEIRLLQVFSRDQLINLRQSEKSSQLGFFATTNSKWKLLNLVIHYSVRGESLYKSKIMKHLKMSLRNFDTIIKEAVERGLFQILPAYNAKANSKIKNIRPSENLIIEYIKYNTSRLGRGIKNIKRYGIK